MELVAHSDFLIHWTGEDIDRNYDPNWWNSKVNRPNKEIVAPYIERLKFLLRFGLWMKDGKGFIEFQGKTIKRPQFARTCFTELKLSQAREHAIKFGRLGIGFKRMFVCDRMGLPMVYFRPEKHNWFISPYLKNNIDQKDGKSIPLVNEYWACFLKSMDEKHTPGELLQYKQFNESEWRIIYSEEIKQKLIDLKLARICDYFKRPEEINDAEFQKYLSRMDPERKLRYLVPLDGGSEVWFAMIIYPNLPTKVYAEKDPEIRGEIDRLKPVVDEKDWKRLNGSASYEKFNRVIEMDLDACRNF
jgi:hypothetical protein